MPSLAESAAAVMPSIQEKLATISGSFNVLAKVVVEQGHADEVEAILKEVAELARSDKEPETLTYRISRGIKGDDHTFIVYEEYASPTALGVHTSSPLFQKLAAYPHVVKADLEVYKEL